MMNSHEAFYVHVGGEQLGPYTVRHIDHLLNSGLIPAETLYWTEGLEQWLPVTNLVPLRKPRRRWMTLLVTIAVLIPLGVLAVFFGPTVVDGWREQSQRHYSAEAAYWAARGIIREGSKAAGRVPRFAPIEAAHVELKSHKTAVVELRGDWLSPHAGSLTEKVELRFDEKSRIWSSTTAPASTR
jgi:hypothetical protein